MPAVEVLAHRIVWSLVVVSVMFVVARKGGEAAAALRSRRTLGTLAVTTALISLNWGLFIWAVQSGRLLQASLGYYINPLINVVLGVVVLQERLRRAQVIAVALALLGVVVLAVAGGVLPWVSLLLAGSFGLYGLLRKTAPVDALTGLFVETALLSPVALVFLVIRESSGQGALLTGSVAHGALLAACGLVTALPLLWFTAAARRLPLSVLGFFQYVAPTLQFLLAVLRYGEKITPAHAVTFALIWTALGLFTLDARRQRLAARAASEPGR